MRQKLASVVSGPSSVGAQAEERVLPGQDHPVGIGARHGLSLLVRDIQSVGRHYAIGAPRGLTRPVPAQRPRASRIIDLRATITRCPSSLTQNGKRRLSARDTLARFPRPVASRHKRVPQSGPGTRPDHGPTNGRAPLSRTTSGVPLQRGQGPIGYLAAGLVLAGLAATPNAHAGGDEEIEESNVRAETHLRLNGAPDGQYAAGMRTSDFLAIENGARPRARRPRAAAKATRTAARPRTSATSCACRSIRPTSSPTGARPC